MDIHAVGRAFLAEHGREKRRHILIEAQAKIVT